MATLRAGGGFSRGTNVALAWAFSLIALPVIINVLATGVKIAIGHKHDIPWYGGDLIVIGQIAVTPLQFVSLARTTQGTMRASFAVVNAAVLLAAEVTAMVMLSGH